MASLAALVAGLASRVERAAVGGGAVARDVAELATGVALHGLGLAVAGEVVGAAALVAGRRARAAGEATTAVAASIAATANRTATAHADGGRVGAGTGQMAGLAAVVAAPAGASAAQAQSRAVSLDVTEALAVVALLGLRGAGKRAAVGLVARLLAVIAKALSGGADLGIVANVATLVARTTRERRHFECVLTV